MLLNKLVTGTDDFWKVRGLIDGFEEVRRQIASRVEKTADDSMSAIFFCTTTKVDLMHHSNMFRNPDPLGADINNVAFLRLGTMLYIYIQKRKEAVKRSKFQKDIGGTTVCMKRLDVATKGYVQLTP